tara:strand:+ start:57036 stop:57488 length:453 start_codon:yes stop_codon:yes gene_type:complete
MIKFFFNFLQRLRKALAWLLNEKGSPAQRARGMAVGVFSGCFPFFGFQSLLGIMLASFFRGNRLIAICSTWISNPLTYVPLYWFNFKIGSLLLGDTLGASEFQGLSNQELWNQGWFFSSRLLLGSSLVGAVFGFMSGLTLYVLLKNFRDK